MPNQDIARIESSKFVSNKKKSQKRGKNQKAVISFPVSSWFTDPWSNFCDPHWENSSAITNESHETWEHPHHQK